MTNDRPTECPNSSGCSIVLRPGERCPVCDGVGDPEGENAVTDRTVLAEKIEPAHLAAYAKGLEDALQIVWEETQEATNLSADIVAANRMSRAYARIRALSPLPPGSRVVVVPPEGSEEWERAMARGMDASYRAVGFCGLNSEQYLKLRLTYALAAALRALTGGDDR